jgi:hypothetical protein
MNESPQQYADRILSNLEGKDTLKVLKSSPFKIKKMIAGVSRKKLYTKPAPGKWSVAQIVAHLADSELVLGWRYRSVAEKNGIILQPYDQDIWMGNSHHEKSDIALMLGMFGILRKINLKFLTGLPKEKLRNYGMHQERGKETIEHIMNLEAGHDLNHLKQIEKILNRNKLLSI